MLIQQPAETSLDLMPIRYVQAGRFKVHVALRNPVSGVNPFNHAQARMMRIKQG